jgi:K+-sensing histidine kinase KdpD
MTRVEEAQAVIDIIDEGWGINPRHLERVFGLFEQLHPWMTALRRVLALVWL